MSDSPKVLVVYATKSGCTRSIAEKIGETIAATGASVDVIEAGAAGAPTGYDAVVVGSGVRAGSWHGAARTWMTAHAPELRAVPVALFTCGLTAADAEKATDMLAYTEPLIAETGISPVSVGLFAGWFEPKRFGLIERTILKAMKSPEGDFRDLAAVARWADEVAPSLSAAR